MFFYFLTSACTPLLFFYFLSDGTATSFILLCYFVINILQLAVQLEEFDVIMHPVMQQLIKQKWNKFGKWGAVIDAGIHFLYILIWTILGIQLPKADGDTVPEYYSAPRLYWSIPLEVFGVLLTLYFLLHVSNSDFAFQRDNNTIKKTFL